MSYTVKVVREDDQWTAEVLGLDGAFTYAGNLVALDSNVREVIALVEDFPEGAESQLDVAYEYEGVSEEFVEAARVGAARVEMEAAVQHLADQSLLAVTRLARSGWSVRDISRAVQLSPGRVSQLLNPGPSSKGGTRSSSIKQKSGTTTSVRGASVAAGALGQSRAIKGRRSNTKKTT